MVTCTPIRPRLFLSSVLQAVGHRRSAVALDAPQAVRSRLHPKDWSAITHPPSSTSTRHRMLTRARRELHALHIPHAWHLRVRCVIASLPPFPCPRAAFHFVAPSVVRPETQLRLAEACPTPLLPDSMRPLPPCSPPLAALHYVSLFAACCLLCSGALANPAAALIAPAAIRCTLRVSLHVASHTCPSRHAAAAAAATGSSAIIFSTEVRVLVWRTAGGTSAAPTPRRRTEVGKEGREFGDCTRRLTSTNPIASPHRFPALSRLISVLGGEEASWRWV